MTERFNYYSNNQENSNETHSSKIIKLDGFRSKEVSKSLEWDESRECAYSQVEDVCARLHGLPKGCSLEDIRDAIGSVDMTSLFEKVSWSDKTITTIIGVLQHNDTMNKKDISKYLWAVDMWWTIRLASKKFDIQDRIAA